MTTTRTITLAGASGHLAQPDKPRAGMLMLPTVFGHNKFVLDYAQLLAEAGFASLVWNPYPGEPLPDGLEAATARAARIDEPAAFAAMRQCVAFLLDELRVPAAGTIGFCLGGRFVLELAAQEKRLSAGCSVYPTVSAGEEAAVLRAASAIECPVQLVYPARDHITSQATFAKLQAALETRAAETAILHYPAADHGFMHRPNPANEQAARRAKPQITAFLAAQLG